MIFEIAVALNANEVIAQVTGTLIIQRKGTNTVIEATIHIITNANGQATAELTNINIRYVPS